VIVSGIRRDQTVTREKMPLMMADDNHMYRLHPMLNWDRQQVSEYRKKFNLPSHPLTEQGYLSIGCEPCTKPTGEGKNERAGRWMGLEKTECGLHGDVFPQ